MTFRVKVNIGLSVLLILLAFTPANYVFPSEGIFLVMMGLLTMIATYSSIIALLQKENHWISIATLMIGNIPFIYFLYVIVAFFVDPL